MRLGWKWGLTRNKQWSQRTLKTKKCALKDLKQLEQPQAGRDPNELGPTLTKRMTLQPNLKIGGKPIDKVRRSGIHKSKSHT